MNRLLNKDPIENDGENVARAIIQIKNRIIKKIHTFDSLIFDPCTLHPFLVGTVTVQ